MSVVNISRYLLFFAWNLNSQKDDGQPSTIEHFFLSLCQKVKKRITDSFRSGGSQRLCFIFSEAKFGLLDSFLFGDKLVSGENLCFRVIALNGYACTYYLSWRASSMSPKYIRSSLVI